MQHQLRNGRAQSPCLTHDPGGRCRQRSAPQRHPLCWEKTARCAGGRGAYLGQLQPTAAGQYNVSVLDAAGGASWLNFSASVAAGRALPAASTAQGPGLYAAAVGQVSGFTVRRTCCALPAASTAQGSRLCVAALSRDQQLHDAQPAW